MSCMRSTGLRSISRRYCLEARHIYTTTIVVVVVVVVVEVEVEVVVVVVVVVVAAAAAAANGLSQNRKHLEVQTPAAEWVLMVFFLLESHYRTRRHS